MSTSNDRCNKEFGGSIHVEDLHRIGSGLSESLFSTGSNKGEFDALLAYLINYFNCSGSRKWRIVNCQGWAIIWEAANCGVVCSWEREPSNSPCYKLPGLTPPVDAEKEAFRRRVSELQARNSTLETDVQREKDKNQELEKRVAELTSKLQPAAEEPWNKGAVPQNGLPLEDLDVLNIPKNISLKIIKAPAGALNLVEDTTTNVRVSRFHGGIELVAVNLEELVPDKDEARFDPEFWGSYTHAGTSYAARKLFKSEI